MAESVVLLTRREKARDKKFPVVGKGKSHFHRLIARIPGGPYYTVYELAFLIERDPKTIKRWLRGGKIGPASKTLEVYGELVYLYTADDVERFREFAERQ